MNQQKFNDIVSMFMKVKDQHGHSLGMHDLLIQDKDQCYVHHFSEDRLPRDIRSISKTVMTIILGVVIRLSEEGKYPEISEETYIYPIIKNAIQLENKENEDPLKKVKIKHLLTHTVGYADVLLMRGDIIHRDPFEYLNDIVNHPIVHEPGEYYLYSNAGFYLLSVVLQEFLQEDLLVFTKRELFDPLGMQHVKWEKYGNYIAGATRLWLLPKDLLKFGTLFLQRGEVSGKQYISENWIQKMLTMNHYTGSVDTPGATFRRYAYGYGIWLAKDPFYFGHGTDGQTLTIIPEKEMVIITLADQSDMKPMERLINDIIINEIE